MISFWRIFSLEFTSLVRSKTLVLLTVASVGWMLALPYIARGDGTEAGARELYIHYSLGGVFVLLVVTLLASATGAIASERAAKRLQLTMVRPVRYFAIALGKILALVAAGAIVLAVSVGVLACRADLSRRCNHVLSPILPSPREEAKAMYESYMKDPETPEAVKRTKKEIVVRLLTQRAVDHYQTVETNATTSWRFGLSDLGEDIRALAVRMRFTNQMEMRQDVIGRFRLAEMTGVVSNITQAVLEIPLAGPLPDASREAVLGFENSGKSALMLRPRKDINLLVPADPFLWNLLRAYLALVAVLALIVSAGVFLSASLGRPVALFVAFVTLIVGEMSPSVVEQYPDELETKLADRIGLHITRFAAEVTRPVSSLAPLESLAKDECVERTDVLRLVGLNLFALPVALSLLAAFVLPRKQED